MGLLFDDHCPNYTPSQGETEYPLGSLKLLPTTMVSLVVVVRHPHQFTGILVEIPKAVIY